MIQYNKYTLSNGLRVIFHKDTSTPMVAVNVLYDVGARDENPDQTGFAHLFEHLMFGGSVNIPNYDEPLQMAGGENNAYTTNDITNYYIQLPKENIETALWLESDRMLSLAFNENSLEVQRKVVCEEFKEHYINKPYGDAWKLLRGLAYKQHPYQWMTIGKELSHIENAQLSDVKAFFQKHYNPQNAILCIAGNMDEDITAGLVEKWFGNIPAGEKYHRNLPVELPQKEARMLEVTEDVPLDALMKAWPIEARMHKEYYVADLITEILGSGQASILHQALVKEEQIFVGIGCYHTGSLDSGLLVIEGKVSENITIEVANDKLNHLLMKFCANKLEEQELINAKNKVESAIVFEDMNLLSRANNLAFYELLGDAAYMNEELNNYASINAADVQQYAQSIFSIDKCNTLFYRSKNKTAVEA